MHFDEQPELKFRIDTAKLPSEYLLDLLSAGADSTYLNCKDIPFGSSLGLLDRVPMVRAAHGRAVLEEAHWGHDYGGGLIEDLRYCKGQTLGYPCCIPTTAIIIESEDGLVEIRDAGGENLWLAATYYQRAIGAQIDVVPLCIDSGPDLQPYATLQPLFIPVHALPKPGVWAFISPYGAAHLRHPSPEGSLLVAVSHQIGVSA